MVFPRSLWKSPRRLAFLFRIKLNTILFCLNNDNIVWCLFAELSCVPSDIEDPSA